MTPREKLVYEALRFSVWAAGEGIGPVRGEPAESPEDFLYDYSVATGDQDWEMLPSAITKSLSGG